MESLSGGKKCTLTLWKGNSKDIPFSEASQDGDGRGDAGLVNIDLLEASLQGRVLLNVLAVLIKGGGANASQLATPQHRLQQVACKQTADHCRADIVVNNMPCLVPKKASCWANTYSKALPLHGMA